MISPTRPNPGFIHQREALKHLQMIADFEPQAARLGKSQAAKALQNLCSQARRYLFHLDKSGECRESKTSLPDRS
jgi:hypothetical protein